MREGGLERWFAIEMGGMQRAFVAQSRPLHELIAEAAPTAATRGGEPHAFDKDVLRRFHDALGPLARRRLRLPVTFFVDRELPNDAYLQDEAAVELLRALGEIGPDAQPRDGRLWLGHARARVVHDKYPRAFQFAYH